jgi:hypothetical protein
MFWDMHVVELPLCISGVGRTNSLNEGGIGMLAVYYRHGLY